MEKPSARKRRPSPARSREFDLEGKGYGYLVRYTHRLFAQALAVRLTGTPISPSQWSALRALWDEDGYSQVELADRIGVQKASLTSVLNSLVRMKVVRRTRNTRDRRSFNLYLTPRGVELKSMLWPLAVQVNRQATAGIDREQLDIFRKILLLMIRNLKNGSTGAHGAARKRRRRNHVR